MRRYIPKNPLQYRLWSFATSPFCEYTVFIAILLNTTSLAMKFYHQPTAYTDFLDVLNQIFTYFFLIECILKLGAFRFKVKYIHKFACKTLKEEKYSNCFKIFSELFPRSLECVWFFHRGRIISGSWPGLIKCKSSRNTKLASELWWNNFASIHKIIPLH